MKLRVFDETYDYLSHCRCGCGSINSFYELLAGAMEHRKTSEQSLAIEGGTGGRRKTRTL